MDRDRLGHKRHTKEASGIIIVNIETEGNVDHCGIKIWDMKPKEMFTIAVLKLGT